jgi:hypothetical protein
MPKQITLRVVVRTLARLRHKTEIGPNVTAYTLMKKSTGPSLHNSSISRFLLETAAQMNELTAGKDRCPGRQLTIADDALRILRQRDGRIRHAVDNAKLVRFENPARSAAAQLTNPHKFARGNQ